MTDDEMSELRLDFEQTADWRRSKAAESPEGRIGRNRRTRSQARRLGALFSGIK